ncbi:MAG: amidohydrolase, partial [Clostridiales bacterium]|nr:amidohydrolase [Clostridiales bacterium]
MAGKIFDPGCIWIEGKTIKKIGDKINEFKNTDDIVIDAQDCWVLPGLIDAHSHLGLFEEKRGQVGDNSNET